MTSEGEPRLVFRTEPALTDLRCSEGLGRSFPPSLPPGSPEEGPASSDPAGNWGPVDGDAQLSLRLATNRFVLGQMITAYVIFRNCGGSTLSYESSFVQAVKSGSKLHAVRTLRDVLHRCGQRQTPGVAALFNQNLAKKGLPG